MRLIFVNNIMFKICPYILNAIKISLSFTFVNDTHFFLFPFIRNNQLFSYIEMYITIPFKDVLRKIGFKGGFFFKSKVDTLRLTIRCPIQREPN